MMTPTMIAFSNRVSAIYARIEALEGALGVFEKERTALILERERLYLLAVEAFTTTPQDVPDGLTLRVIYTA